MTTATPDLRALRGSRLLRIVGALAAVGIAALAAGLTWYRGGHPHATGGGALHSLPGLQPPRIDVLRTSPLTAPGDIFIAPKHAGPQNGPMILSPGGRTLWFHRMPKGIGTFDFRVQRYQGKPVLTWFQGRVVDGHGQGEGIIANSHYRVIARIHAGNGLTEDLHELQLTPRGTALITAYRLVHRDLRPYGGAKDGEVWEGVLQEVDVRTGRVLLQWNSLDHVPLSASYFHAPKQAGKPWDYFHINSIGVDRDGNLLVSARQTWAVYKIDRQTGHVIWTLGGKQSDFRMGPGAQFAYQHHVRRAPDGTITIFDNRSPPAHGTSRGLALRVNEKRRTATVARQWRHGLVSTSQGSVQTLPNGDVFIGWGGRAPYFSEYARDGRLLFDARFGDRRGDTYRAYRFPWVGHPRGRPAVATSAASSGRMNVYASWNGATQVRTWRVLGGASRGALRPLGEGPWTDLESDVHVARAPFVAVQALAADGRVLGTSRTIAGLPAS